MKEEKTDLKKTIKEQHSELMHSYDRETGAFFSGLFIGIISTLLFCILTSILIWWLL